MSKGIQLTLNYWDFGCRKIAPKILSCYSNDGRANTSVRAILAVPSAILKTLLFPVTCLIGLVVFPIIALISLTCESQCSDKYMTATVLCFLGAVASIGFLAAAAFYQRLTIRTTLWVTAAAFSISIGIHVSNAITPHKACAEDKKH